MVDWGTGIKPRNRLQTRQTSPKCQRETTAPNDDYAEKLTQSSIRDAIREQLREERHILTGELRDGLAEVHQRIDTVEKTTTTPSITDKHIQLDAKIDKIEELAGNLGNRLELLQGKQPSSQSAQEDQMVPLRRVPGLLVFGGWSSKQAASETLRFVKQHVAQLRSDLDMEEAFIPGLRRVFCHWPLVKGKHSCDEESRRHCGPFEKPKSSPDRDPKVGTSTFSPRLNIDAVTRP